jgi:hypothetical protein
MVTLNQFDIERVQTIAEGCPDHPAYRVKSSLPDYTPDCSGCAKVYAATAILAAMGVIDVVATMRFERARSLQKQEEAKLKRGPRNRY